MFQLFLHIYVFLAWTGAWSTHTGLSALMFLFLWVVAVTIGIVGAFFAPSILSTIISFSVGATVGRNAGKAALNIADGIDIAMNITFIIPILIGAVVASLGYLVGLGDLLNWILPSLFPKEGYLFSDQSIPLWAYIVPSYLCYTYYSMLDRFDVIDDVIDSIRAHMRGNVPESHPNQKRKAKKQLKNGGKE